MSGAADFLPPELLGGQRPCLLVVDDEPLNVQALYTVFAKDCQVLVATDGESALALCARRQPDLVLLDIGMPGIDGFEVCRRLQAHPSTRGVPVIFVTARDDADAETQGLSCGAVDFIVKPIHPAIVRARVRTHLTLKLQSDLLRQMVFIDGLTGVHNRRFFDERLDAEWGRAMRNRTPLSLLMVDIDHFKRLNDQLGHQAGDQRLRQVAEVLRRCIRRTSDVVARYGGEEFACVLPDSEPDAVMLLGRMIVERVREDIGQLHPDHPSTVSVGVACKPADFDPRHGSFQDLLALADSQLYAAKAAGRNTLRGRVIGQAEALALPSMSLAGN
ncbi:diguanylate cyclase [Ideonella alba]|uniref:diguanylate cyclase n=1 Tax=Ideonella alba TaxID=2824118 RepID=A0A940YHF0_9BURK|nr:diguanylate cyclase [Ideonella alba]MBQ0929969.1 diguanylate cyclase [Ideonella alba]